MTILLILYPKMPTISKRTLAEVDRHTRQACGLRVFLMDTAGASSDRRDALGRAARVRRARTVAFHESVTRGAPSVFAPASGLLSFVIPLEDRRIVQGALVSAAARGHAPGPAPTGNPRTRQPAPPPLSEERLREVAVSACDLFYRVSGWKPVLLEENRVRTQQQEQLAQAIEDRRRDGAPPVYPFEKERLLLAHIKAGDHTGARRLLNDTLASMYLTSPQLPVLRARAVELMGYLTRAAVEDSPVMEPLIERNHGWMARLIQAQDFESLSRVLMQALDDFVEGIYLHGATRSNSHVGRALDFIATHYRRPIALREVAEAVGLSPCRTAHLVKAHTGRTVVRILNAVRVREAQRLLVESSKSCTDVAYETGFGDQSYFIKQFRRLTGTTPARYRRSRMHPRPSAEPAGPA